MLAKFDFFWVGLVSYTVSHLLHLIVWRTGFSRKITAVFHLLFVMPLLAYLIVCQIKGLEWAWEWGGVPLILHELIAANYFAIFPAFQASSPTVKILTFLGKHRVPVSEERLLTIFGSPSIITDRVNDLINSGLLAEDDQQLSRRGDWLASAFIWYRKALGLPMGVG